MFRYSLFLACAALLLHPAAVCESRAWYAYHYHRGGGVGYRYGGGYRLGGGYRFGGYAGYRYPAYGRGVDQLLGTYNYLDLTPLGRQRYVTEFPYHDTYNGGS